MAHGELIDYIKKATEHGQTKEQIHANLINAGWLGADIDAAFSSMEGAPVPPVPMASHPVASAESNPLPSAVEMWKRAWGVFRKRTGSYMGIAVVSSAASIIVGIFVDKKSFGLLMLAVMIILPFVQLVVAMAFMFAVQGGEAVGVAEAYRRAFGKLPRAIWLSIIAFIIVTGWSGFFFVPGLLLSGWFIFAIYVLAFENQGGMNALFYSREYIRGKWWSAVGFTLLPVFIAVVVVVIVNLIIGIFKLPYLTQVINGIIGLVLAPVSAIYMYMVYAGFKARKGQVVVKITAGRKAKYLVLGLVGLIIPIVIFGGSILMMMFAARGNGPIPNAAYKVPAGFENSHPTPYDSGTDLINIPR